MEVIKRDSITWEYLSEEIQGLIVDGELLLDHAKDHMESISDYSYLVFPFSKAYEGFLKRLFLDLDLMREDEYYSDEIRIGRVLNPNYMKEKENVFYRLCGSKEVAKVLWDVWKRGRNQVFHYFPHNFRRLGYDEALGLIKDIVFAMNRAIMACKLK